MTNTITPTAFTTQTQGAIFNATFPTGFGSFIDGRVEKEVGLL